MSAPFVAEGEGFTKQGEWLVPGKNVDKVNIDAGLALSRQIGYGDPQSQMVLTYALQRWSRGEEAGAEATTKGFIDYTSWRMVLAAALAGAFTPGEHAEREAADTDADEWG